MLLYTHQVQTEQIHASIKQGTAAQIGTSDAFLLNALVMDRDLHGDGTHMYAKTYAWAFSPTTGERACSVIP